MSFVPRQRSRIGITPFTVRPSDIDAYDGFPFRPYPKYERVAPRDLVQILENNFQHLWRECAPDDIPLKYQGLKTIAQDELYENHPDNVVGHSDKENKGERAAPIFVKKVKPAKPIEKPTERAALTKAQILGKDHLDPFIRKFYPDCVFNRSGIYK